MMACEAESVGNASAVRERLMSSDRIRLIVEPVDGQPAKRRSKDILISGSPRDMALSRLEEGLGSQGMRPEKRMPLSGKLVYEVNREQFERIVGSGLVANVYEDKVARPALNGAGEELGADVAYDLGYDGAGSIIAVLDTGIDSNHPMFQGAIVSEACFSTNGYNGKVTSNCPGGVTGYVGPGAAGVCAQNSCDHGTRVSSIAMGRPYMVGGVEYKGIAHQAGLIAVQVFSTVNDAVLCNGWPVPCQWAMTSDIEEGLNWVISNLATNPQIASVNISIGGEDLHQSHCEDDVLEDEIAYLKYVANVATVIGTGNDSSYGVTWPSCVRDAVAVTAAFRPSDYAIESFANRHPDLVDLASINRARTAYPGGGIDPDIGWGTSFATPHVAGAFAILKQMNPYAYVSDIEGMLVNTAGSAREGGTNLYYPLVDMAAASEFFHNRPIARFDRSFYVFPQGQSRQFSAYRSANPASSPLTYTWDKGDGTSIVPTLDAEISQQYVEPGRYVASLTVSNGIKTSEEVDVGVRVYTRKTLNAVMISIF